MVAERILKMVYLAGSKGLAHMRETTDETIFIKLERNNLISWL
jgi:hypothetical protein